MITILTRKNLIRESEDISIEDIGVQHVRGSLLPIQRSDLVLLVDDKIRVLKDKYGFGINIKLYEPQTLEWLITQHLEKMDNEKRLAEIEVELEKVHDEIDLKEQNEPPYDSEDPAGSWEKFKAYMKTEWDKQAKLNREKRMLMTPEFDELSTYGDVMSLKDFIGNVECGGFIDYDGHGRYVRDGKESDILIYPSDVKHDSVRKDFDTIIWFNR